MSKFPTNVAITYTALAQTQGMPGNTFTYTWTFDDGGTGNTTSLAHTWTTDGNHLATILATDAVTGGKATATKFVSTSSATWLGNTATNRTWGTMTYGNGLFVAAANDNATGVAGIMTSPDGSTWSSVTSPVASNFIGSAYGNGVYVLVGTHAGTNYVVYSSNGSTWNVPTFPNKQWQCVAYGSNTFVALSYLNGTTGQAMTSPDGINWTSQNTSSNQAWTSICYGGGKFVSVSTGTTTATSSDGIVWTSASGAPNQGWVSIAYGNGIYVAVANVVITNQIMWSSDGLVWNQVSTPDANIQLGSVSFGDGQFCITPTNTGLTWGSYLTPDCVSFFKITTNSANGSWRASVYGTDRFVATSSNGGASQHAQVLLW